MSSAKTALVTAGSGLRCVHVSTDFVFDGRRAERYAEGDVPCPVNVYGAPKFAGEYLVRHSSPDWMIVRVASLFGKSGSPRERWQFCRDCTSEGTGRRDLSRGSGYSDVADLHSGCGARARSLSWQESTRTWSRSLRPNTRRWSADQSTQPAEELLAEGCRERRGRGGTP